MNNRPAPANPPRIASKVFRIRTSKNLLPLPLPNQHLQAFLGTAETKRLTARQFLPQLLSFQHLRKPSATAENKRFTTPSDSALTKKHARNPSRISKSKKTGGGRGPSLWKSPARSIPLRVTSVLLSSSASSLSTFDWRLSTRRSRLYLAPRIHLAAKSR